jgi:hypothetical protein
MAGSTSGLPLCRNKDELDRAKVITRKRFGDSRRVEFKTIFEFTAKKRE